MVWDPKGAIGHSDYGSFERQGSSSNPEEDSQHPQLRAGASLPLSPLHSQQATTSNMSDTDLIQRQPLLPLPAKNGHHITVEYEEDGEDHSEDEGRSGVKANGVVKINIPKTEREEQRYPKEKWKTLMAFLCVFFGTLMSVASLSLVHEKVPDKETYPPLPDIFFEFFPQVDWALDVSEIIIMVSSNVTFLIILFHKHRYIVFRRMFLIIALLYLMRSVTMYVTVLPMSSTTYYCSPKANVTTPWLLTKRVWQLMSGFGLSINGKHTYCGDFIFSGHTVVLTLCYLLINEYSPDSPKRLFQLLSWTSFIASTTAVFMVLLSRGHYTIDVVIAYFATTRTFWIYHTLANNASLKKPGPHNYLARAWWFPIFRYFEGNVGVKVPRQHEWPLPWPRRFLHKPPNRNS
ncbi:phosphatidylcholine:ceramide cholinephosphotransferase 2 isoform X2 [Frankliniella occidentalis]|nr:phosphatidylcholine:ceramide cholinephosphotransferase 2 isoform X2 [Frankliniella occidentalis]XP_052128955.1 phosphatidylcholine:ceramide cholinephosphotransferase 2 isoform X2 [Frankliniella occidentalis]